MPSYRVREHRCRNCDWWSYPEELTLGWCRDCVHGFAKGVGATLAALAGGVFGRWLWTWL